MIKRFLFTALIWLILWPALAQISTTGAGLGTPPSGVCSQATTFLARTSGLSGPQTTAIQNGICTMVTDGSWALLVGLYIFPVNTATTANLNWISTSYGLTAAGASPPTFTSGSGYTGTTTGYFDTGFNPSTAGSIFTQNSASIGECTLTSRTASQAYTAMGLQNQSNFIADMIIPFGSSGFQGPLNDANYPNFIVGNVQGSFVVSRQASTSVSMYINGSSVATPADTSGALQNMDIYIFAQNNAGTAASFDQDELGYVYFGQGMTSGQVSTINSDLHALLVALGAPSGC
jgi:hypothetical protein